MNELTEIMLANCKGDKDALLAKIKLTGHEHKAITTQNDIEETRNYMIKGNYPASITDCEVVGIHGYCGSECPVLARGDCEEKDNIIKAIKGGE